MNQITVGKKRNVTFIPFDQNGNPNPVGPDGQPLTLVPGTITWFLGPLEGKLVRAPREEIVGVTLVPSEDGLNCDVIADEAGVSAALHCSGDRGDGVFVQGGSIFETVSEAGPVTVIAGLTLQWGEEKPK